MITWKTNVLSIITLASQAFALFYFLQCAVAFSITYDDIEIENRSGRLALFAAVGLLCLCITLFGIPSGG